MISRRFVNRALRDVSSDCGGRLPLFRDRRSPLLCIEQFDKYHGSKMSQATLHGLGKGAERPHHQVLESDPRFAGLKDSRTEGIRVARSPAPFPS